MKLGARITPDSVVIYREKWGVLALGVALGGACIGFAIWFYALGAARAPASFLVPFCAAFMLAGLALWLRLPAEASKWFAQDGLILLRADARGVEIAPLPGAAPALFRWSDVSEIAFVESLDILEFDGTTYSWRQVILFLRDDTLAGASRLDLARAGLERSAEGHLYARIGYPSKEAAQLHDALRARAPDDVAITRCLAATFDHVARMDMFDEKPGAHRSGR